MKEDEIDGSNTEYENIRRSVYIVVVDMKQSA